MFVTRIRAGDADGRSPYGDFWFEPVSTRTSSNVRVGADSAMRLTAVYACVRILAETMGCLPFCLYRTKKSGGRDLVTDHWLHQLLARQPNQYQDRFQWREMEQGHLALRGNGYNEIIANSRGEVEQLVPLHPDRVRIEYLAAGGYRFRIREMAGGERILPAGSVFKLTGLQSNGLIGLSPLEVARESIGEGLAQQEFSARFFANDARPLGGWIEYPGDFSDPAKRKTFTESWQQAQAGANRGRTAVLDRGMKYHEVGMNNRDSQFIEARKFKVTDVARIFRVPPHMVADLEKSTNNNIEWQSMEFVRYTMLPWAERWEAAIESQLLVDEGMEVEFDFAALERGDAKTRAEYYNLGVTGGWLVRNEVRIKEGMNPIDGLDAPLQPLNMAPAGSAPKPSDNGGGDAGEQQQDDAADARARALELAVAGRVVRKEIVAARKAWEKHGRDPQSWQAWLAEFYGSHVDYVVSNLLCMEETASAWCDRQHSELSAAGDVMVTLEAWEQAAAAELAARVRA